MKLDALQMMMFPSLSVLLKVVLDLKQRPPLRLARSSTQILHQQTRFAKSLISLEDLTFAFFVTLNVHCGTPFVSRLIATHHYVQLFLTSLRTSLSV